MNKGTRLIKRVMALLIVLLLSIDSFAAVVSDNDGSAFITKAEFDSLKNSFQAQIDQYNTSIDSKIDGAIASYLAGIKVAQKTNLKSLIETLPDEKREFRFAAWNAYNSGNVVAGDAGIQIVRIRGYWTSNSQSQANLYTIYTRLFLTSGTSFGTVNNYSSNPQYGWWTAVRYDRDNGCFYVPENYQYREIMHYRAANGMYSAQDITSEPAWSDESTYDTTDTVFNPDNTSANPVVKTYKFKFQNEDINYLSALTSTLTLGSSDDNYCGNLRTQCFNALGSTQRWFLDYDNQGTYTNAKKFAMDTTCYRKNSIVYKRTNAMVQSQVKSGGANEFPISISTYSPTKITMPLTDIKNLTLTNLTGEVVSLYSGIPVCYLPGKTGKLTFDLELSSPAIVCMNYGQFENEEITETGTKYDKYFGRVEGGTHKLEIDMSDGKWSSRNGILWLKLNRTSGISRITVNVTNIVFESE